MMCEISEKVKPTVDFVWYYFISLAEATTSGNYWTFVLSKVKLSYNDHIRGSFEFSLNGFADKMLNNMWFLMCRDIMRWMSIIQTYFCESWQLYTFFSFNNVYSAVWNYISLKPAAMFSTERRVLTCFSCNEAIR